MAERELEIKVFLHPDSKPPFHLECPELGLDAHNYHAVFSNDGHDGFLLTYALQDPDYDYRFPSELKDALWCHKKTNCPTTKTHWGQFFAKEVKSGNRHLVVRNRNNKGEEGNFSYTLRVTKQLHDSDADFLELDPGGTNTNGPTKPFLFRALGIALGAGVVSALATTGLLMSVGLTCSR